MIVDEAGVTQKFGVAPASIPDYLALVGDAADGYPGLQGWGAKSAAAVLARFGHLEAIPDDRRDVARQRRELRRAGQDTGAGPRPSVMLFRNLATLRTDCRCSVGRGAALERPDARVRRARKRFERRWSPPSRARRDRE